MFNKILISFTMIIMVLFLLPKTLQVENEIYLSPWSVINKAKPKIIDFKPNGEVKTRNVPIGHIISLKKIVKNFRMNMKNILSSNDPSTWNTSYLLQGINKHINKMSDSSRPKTKLKILTNCNKNLELCRFLACPNIKKNCILCEVQMKSNSKNTTTCAKYSTTFLITRGQI